jgi:hypothetical protein
LIDSSGAERGSAMVLCVARIVLNQPLRPNRLLNIFTTETKYYEMATRHGM